MPVYATFFWLIVLASIGLPLLNGFVGEFLVLSGAFQARPCLRHLAATGVIWSAGYMLWMYQRVFYGKSSTTRTRRCPTQRPRAARPCWPCVAMRPLVMGVAPLRLDCRAIDGAAPGKLFHPSVQLPRMLYRAHL